MRTGVRLVGVVVVVEAVIASFGLAFGTPLDQLLVILGLSSAIAAFVAFQIGRVWVESDVDALDRA